MGNMLQRAKSILRTNSFTVLYDKGYHTGSEFKTAHWLFRCDHATRFGQIVPL
jgi:hypothetical protein